MRRKVIKLSERVPNASPEKPQPPRFYKQPSVPITPGYSALSTSSLRRLRCTRIQFIPKHIRGNRHRFPRDLTLSIHSPETILVLRSLSVFETSFLTRCSNRVNEAIGQVFSGGIRNPPGMAEGTVIGRAIANELDAAKFDPLLSKAVTKGIVTSLEQMVSRWNNLVSLTINEWSPVRLQLNIFFRLYGIGL